MKDSKQDSKKARLAINSNLRHYWWVFGVLAAFVVIIVPIVSTRKNESQSAAEAPGPAPPNNVPVEQVQDVPNSAPLLEAEAASDEPEPPAAEDVEALARYYSTDGIPNIRDAEVFWQKEAGKYIDFLDDETFEQGLSRTYITSEFIFTLGSGGDGSPGDPEVVRYLARTRRLSKLISRVRKAGKQGELESVLDSIEAAVGRLFEHRRELEAWFESALREQPEIFKRGAPEVQRKRVREKLQGVGSTGMVDAEDIIPMSLHGTQYGAVANCFLLGLTEDPRAIKTLLNVASHDSQPLIKKLVDVWRMRGPDWGTEGEDQVKYWFSFANPVVVADALDRILMASAQNPTLNPEALALAKQYKQWQQSRNFPPRQVVQIYAHDAPRTPYHLPGRTTGVPKDAKTAPLELPLELVEHGETLRLHEVEDIRHIIDWAKRFNVALKLQ